jgi:molecular chaperone IbpA
MNSLQRLDTTALAQLNRALIGFDRIFNNYESRFANQTSNYPPYNVLKHDDSHYEIELAVAGFDKDDITVEVNQNELIIRGNKINEEDASKLFIEDWLQEALSVYLHSWNIM